MKIEEGKFYRTRDGEKVGPLEYRRECGDFVTVGFGGPYGMAWWHDTGVRGGAGDIHDGDIVSEWVDGPVRTVTRKEIVQGKYGIVYVMQGGYLGILEGNQYSPDELRAAAATLTEIADALGEAS